MHFMIHGYDATDEAAYQNRLALKAEHVRLADLMIEAGTRIYGASILDARGKPIGSIVICSFESEAELDDYLRKEPYVDRVWEKMDIFPIKPGARYLGAMYRPRP